MSTNTYHNRCNQNTPIIELNDWKTLLYFIQIRSIAWENAMILTRGKRHRITKTFNFGWITNILLEHKRKLLIQNFFAYQFHYCSLIWMFLIVLPHKTLTNHISENWILLMKIIALDLRSFRTRIELLRSINFILERCLLKCISWGIIYNYGRNVEWIRYPTPN